MKIFKSFTTITFGAVLSIGSLSAMAGPSEQYRVTANTISESRPAPHTEARTAIKTIGFQKYVSHRRNQSMPEETAEFAAFEKTREKRDHTYYRRDRSI